MSFFFKVKKWYKPDTSDQPNLSIVRNQPNWTFQPFFVRNYRTEPNFVWILLYFYLELIKANTLETKLSLQADLKKKN